MNARRWALLLVVILLPAALLGLPVTAGSARAATAAAGGPSVSGNISGPTLLALNASQRYVIYGAGGPAVAPNGTLVGNLTYYLGVSAPNMTGVKITPTSAALIPGTPGQPLLEVGSTPQTVIIAVEISSVLNNRTNESINFTWSVTVVTPYVVGAEIVNNNDAIVQSFRVLVSLDGTQVGNVSIPTIQPHTDYNFTYDYATTGLSVGYHTFTISLANAHGLVQFVSGTTTYSETVYVPGPAPDYTLWYVTGAIAFFGVLFIFGARLGARRRTASKK